MVSPTTCGPFSVSTTTNHASSTIPESRGFPAIETWDEVTSLAMTTAFAPSKARATLSFESQSAGRLHASDFGISDNNTTVSQAEMFAVLMAYNSYLASRLTAPSATTSL